MSNIKHASRKEIVDRISNLKLLGEIITWSPGEGERKFKEVVQALKDSNLDEKAAREFSAKSAFSRACKKLSDERVIDVVRDDGDNIMFQFTKKSLQSGNWTFQKEVNLTLNKTSGKIFCTLTELETHAQSELDRCMEARNGGDITKIIQGLFEKEADLFRIRDQGGAYFVPQAYVGFISKIETFVQKLGGHISRFPIPDGTVQGNKAVKESITDSLSDLIKEHNEAVALFGIDTRSSSLEAMAKRIKLTKTKIEAYANYLEDNKDKLLKSLTESDNNLKKRIEKISEEKEEQPEHVVGKDKFGSRLGSRASRLNLSINGVPKTIAELMKDANVINDAGVSGHMKKLISKGFVVKVDDKYKLAKGK